MENKSTETEQRLVKRQPHHNCKWTWENHFRCFHTLCLGFVLSLIRMTFNCVLSMRSSPRKWSLIEMEVDKCCFLSSFLIQWVASFVLRSVGDFSNTSWHPSVIRSRELWENEGVFNDPTMEALKFNFLKSLSVSLSPGRVEEDDEEESGCVRGWRKQFLRSLPSPDYLFSKTWSEAALGNVHLNHHEPTFIFRWQQSNGSNEKSLFIVSLLLLFVKVVVNPFSSRSRVARTTLDALVGFWLFLFSSFHGLATGFRW